MSDDETETGREDHARINLNEDHEVRDWTQSLGVDEATVREALKAVGDRVEDVRSHLRNKAGKS